MKAPAFWYGKAGVAARLLSPLGWLYATAGRAKRSLVRPASAGVPVVCVGNLVVGGSGKTPVALALADLLAGREIAFLTRGYGGALAGPVRVAPERHTAAEVGDEPLLLARIAPTWVSRDRVAGARAAAAGGAAVIVMDDGLQNPSLVQDLRFVVVDGATGFGNGRLAPAGPLREPVASGLARADAVVIVGADATGVAEQVPAGAAVFAARLAPTPAARDLTARRVVAFAGIGRPAKFFATLAELGCIVVARHAFPDHHRFAARDVTAICEEAAALAALPVTTEKDWVRLPPDLQAAVRAVPVALEWQDAERLRALLEKLFDA